MVNDMWEYINSQENVLRNIIDNELKTIRRCIDSLDIGSIDRIIFVGSGTSYNVAIAVKSMYESLLKKEIFVEYPFSLRNYSRLINQANMKSTLLIAISQSGKSVGTKECIEKAKRTGIQIACLTANTNSDIARLSDLIIPILCGDEKVGPKTKGYTATLLTLQIAALYFSRKINNTNRYEYYMTQMNDAINNIDDLILKSNDWITNNINWNKANSIFVIGYGPNFGTALEGSLKILETFRKPACPYDIEEYIHGPYNSLDSDSHIIFIDSAESGTSQMEKLIKFVKNITNHYLVINCHANSVDCDAHMISIPKYDEYIMPLLSIIPFQVIAYKITKSLGVNPEIPRYTNFHDIMGSKKGLVDFN